ncbi:MAG: hypothetical protein O7F12_02055 [Nitrospirae bacterium]|nr:hypothetical protein [Nitrospirota bacterium]
MDVSSVSQSGQSQDVQQKAAAQEQVPPPPPTEDDSVQLSSEAKALASSVLADE